MINFKDMTDQDIFKYVQNRVQINISKNISNIQAICVDPTGAVNFLLNASLLINIICESILEVSKEQQR